MGVIQPIFAPSSVHEGRDDKHWYGEGLPRLLDLMGISPDAPPEIFTESIPFSLNDTTAGAENELQAVVVGQKADVDFPLTIEASNYYKNLVRRAAAGDTPRRMISDLQEFLDENPDNVWENSWVRFPRAVLNEYARRIFDSDLLADKQCPDGPARCDAGKFVFRNRGKRWLRVPISYLLRLSLADVIGASPEIHPALRTAGEQFSGHFLNDNTSPETVSFYPVRLTRRAHMGQGIARETLKRFFLSQLLTQYANRRFGLIENGQQALVYFAPHTHTRQKRLNDLISDSFYRELFMSPCLCGWDRGEDKHRYMGLCHKVLSRSQLNAVSKLREAGIITRNLVVMPALSNVSLGNNGTHISLGSRKLTRLMGDTGSGFGVADEKYLGDLTIKITEHFLPLFVGTYSAAPYRLDFWDFHPEKVLGFLPHELDFTHLRMIWRRWKKKARLKVFGQPVTPFGPQWMDRWISRLFGLRGDFVNDYRLLDYFVAVMSTIQSPALNGMTGNDEALKRDLADFGVFDTRMPMYLLYRMRAYGSMGFSGFEGRYYSQFEDLTGDMGAATTLQTLITALAFRYILSGEVSHSHIPDDPVAESERRQIFFGTAIGLPTFFVRRGTSDRFLEKVLRKVRRTRMSRRYPGYLRVSHREYRRALLELIREDGADLIEMMGLEDTLRDLEDRIAPDGNGSAARKLTRSILDQAGVSGPMQLSGDEFNRAAEKYYRDVLRKRQIRQALSLLETDFRNLDACAILRRDIYRDALEGITDHQSASEFLEQVREDVLAETSDEKILLRLIRLTLLSIYSDMKHNERDKYL
ncbi:hypothetical protein DENIS_2835 [Desulfonema ishimotonii]|uniref:Uncharacterized protein n=1 Tax=Desulfonema ishimotonii TaxID=45657 RepID=A0A401FY61_9BACT|nr:hypothetical protein [Desulfonema ishimotonii]GBC61873.1 hypothetical protein DENIS_2835 [Desulfonema ishimotonii]